MIPYLQLLQQALKINVFGYDYQGYGISKPKERTCSEKRVYSSITAVADYVINILNFPPNKIIL
jgi:hypothetical protein